MTHKLTTNAVKRIITKGLTGWESGKLILQDFIDDHYRGKAILTDADVAAIKNAPLESGDIEDYNAFVSLYDGFVKGHIMGGWACSDACLNISYLEHLFRAIHNRRMVELFESLNPHVVTRQKYEEIVTAQRQKKLEFEFNIGYVIEERFYGIAPQEARRLVEEAGIIKCMDDLVKAVPEAYSMFLAQAIEEIRSLYASGKLQAICRKDDIEKVEPLTAKWREKELSTEDTVRLAEMLKVTGQQLYDCAETPEWKGFVDNYQRYWFDEDERFRHVYAVIEQCPENHTDEQGCYKRFNKPGEWLTGCRELGLGLIDYSGKEKKSIQSVGAWLRKILDDAEQNIRLFLAIKTILDTAVEVVELDMPGNTGTLSILNTKIKAAVSLYNIRIEELHEKRFHWNAEESLLEKTLKTLPTIDIEKLKPCPESIKQLRNEILKEVERGEWLKEKIFALKYNDNFSFKSLT